MDYEVKCPPLPSSIDEKKTPYTAMYFRLFGFQNGMISMWDIPSKYKSAEELYKECIKKKCTWQELTNFDGYDKNEWL